MKKRSNVWKLAFTSLMVSRPLALLPGIRNNGQALLVPFTGSMVNTQGKTIKPAVIWKNDFSVFLRE